MNYCKSLAFEQEPDYEYMRNLIRLMAGEFNLDLNDGMYDWNVKAVTMKYFPHFYDFYRNSDTNVLDDNGKFYLKDVKDPVIEQVIY